MRQIRTMRHDTPPVTHQQPGRHQPAARGIAWLVPVTCLVVVVACFNRVASSPAQGDDDLAKPADKEAETPQYVVRKFRDAVASVAITADGQRFACGTYGLVRIFSSSDRKELGQIEEPAGTVRALAFSPDSRWIATGTYQSVSLWNAETFAHQATLKGHREYVTCLGFSKDGRRLVTGAEDETVCIWNVDSAKLEFKLAHSQPVTCLALSPDGQHVAAGGGDVTRPTRKGHVLLWPLEADAQPRTLGTLDGAVSDLAFSPDGHTLAAGGYDELVTLWDVASGKKLAALEGQSRPVLSLAYLAGGTRLASAGGGRFGGKNTIKIWDAAQPKPLASLEAHDGPVLCLAMSPDGTWLISGSADKTACIWSMQHWVSPATPDKKGVRDAESKPRDAEPGNQSP